MQSTATTTCHPERSAAKSKNLLPEPDAAQWRICRCRSEARSRRRYHWSVNKLAVSLAMCLAVSPQVAAALCSEPQPRLVCAEYFASQVVVEAKLLRIEPVVENHDPDSIDAYFFTLNTARLLRGTIEPTFRVYEGNDSGRASFRWIVGRTYVLFLFKSHDNSGAEAWALDGCGNSGPVSKSAAVLRSISHINPASRVGTVSGVVSAPGLAGELDGVRLAVRGASRSFEVVTDRRGRFQVSVPPGDYAIEAVRPSTPLIPFEFSYEDPNHLHVEPGTCAQVQLTQQYPSR